MTTTATTVDRGWSWMILAGSFGCSFLMFGTLAAAGVLLIAIMDKFDSTPQETMWVLFIMQVCLNVLGPVSGYLGERFSYRKVVIIGGLLAGLGLALSTLAKSVKHLYATFGLVYGLGLGFVVTPHVIVVNLAFERYRAFANGVFSAGASIGSFAVPPLLEALNEDYGLNGLFLIWSGTMLNICVFGAIYRQSKRTKKNKNLEKDVDATFQMVELEPLQHVALSNLDASTENGQLLPTSEKPVVVTKTRQVPSRRRQFMSSYSFFTNVSFWIIALGWCSVTFAISCFAVIVPAFAISQNESITRSKAAFLMSAWAIGDLVGRLGVGWMLDRKWFDLKLTYIVSMIVSSFSVTSTQFLDQYTSFAICAFVFGMALGSAFIQHPLLMIHCLGIEAFQKGFGYLGVCAGIAIIGLTTLVGMLREITNSYHSNFTVVGVFLFLPVVSWLLEIAVSLSRKRRKRAQEIADNVT